MSWDSACSSTPGASKFPAVAAASSVPPPLVADGDGSRDQQDSPLREGKGNKRRRHKKQAESDAASLKEQACQILAMIVIAWAVATCGFRSVEWIRVQLRPFCDSSSGGGENPGDCIPCPDHGFCENGRLECYAGYKRLRKLCVEDTEMDRIAGKLGYHLKGRLCGRTALAICDGTSGAVWLTDEEAQGQMKQEGVQERFRLDEKSWQLVWDKMVGSDEDGLVTQNDFSGDREFKCPPDQIQRHKPLTCRFREWIVAQSVSLIIISPLIIFLASTLKKCVTSRRLRVRAEQVYLQACEELEAKALESQDVPGAEPWVVVSRLRDHVLLPRERKWTPLWRQVEALATEDSRIDQYQKKVKGEMKIVWEWQVPGKVFSSTRTLKKRVPGCAREDLFHEMEGALRTPARQKKKLFKGGSPSQGPSDSPRQA